MPATLRKATSIAGVFLRISQIADFASEQLLLVGFRHIDRIHSLMDSYFLLKESNGPNVFCASLEY